MDKNQNCSQNEDFFFKLPNLYMAIKMGKLCNKYLLPIMLKHINSEI